MKEVLWRGTKKQQPLLKHKWKQQTQYCPYCLTDNQHTVGKLQQYPIITKHVTKLDQQCICELSLWRRRLKKKKEVWQTNRQTDILWFHDSCLQQKGFCCWCCLSISGAETNTSQAIHIFAYFINLSLSIFHSIKFNIKWAFFPSVLWR